MPRLQLILLLSRRVAHKYPDWHYTQISRHTRWLAVISVPYVVHQGDSGDCSPKKLRPQRLVITSAVRRHLLKPPVSNCATGSEKKVAPTHVYRCIFSPLLFFANCSVVNFICKAAGSLVRLLCLCDMSHATWARLVTDQNNYIHLLSQF